MLSTRTSALCDAPPVCTGGALFPIITQLGYREYNRRRAYQQPYFLLFRPAPNLSAQLLTLVTIDQIHRRCLPASSPVQGKYHHLVQYISRLSKDSSLWYLVINIKVIRSEDTQNNDDKKSSFSELATPVGYNYIRRSRILLRFTCTCILMEKLVVCAQNRPAML